MGKDYGKHYTLRIDDKTVLDKDMQTFLDKRVENEILKEKFVIKDKLEYLLWLRDMLVEQREMYDKRRKEKISVLRAMIGADLIEKGINIGSWQVLDQTIQLINQQIKVLELLIDKPILVGDADGMSPTIDRGLRWRGEPEVIE